MQGFMSHPIQNRPHRRRFPSQYHLCTEEKKPT